jgi:hypothetical protein
LDQLVQLAHKVIKVLQVRQAQQARKETLVQLEQQDQQVQQVRLVLKAILQFHQVLLPLLQQKVMLGLTVQQEKFMCTTTPIGSR